MTDHPLDIVIPVYNEGSNILATLGALAREVRTPARVLICYDFEEDDTLPAVRNNPAAYAGLDVSFVRNPRRGAHSRRHGRLCRRHCAHHRGLPRRRRFQCGHHRQHGRPGSRRVRCRLREPVPARRHDGGLPLAEGRPGANGGIHAAQFRGGPDQGSDQRLSHVLAPRDRADRDRVGRGILLQHRTCWSKPTGLAGASARFRRAGSSASMAPADFAS